MSDSHTAVSPEYDAVTDPFNDSVPSPSPTAEEQAQYMQNPPDEAKANGKAAVSSASKAPKKKAQTTLDRSQYTNPELSKPPAERAQSKQTIIPIRKPGSDFFRICPDPDARMENVTVIVGGGSNKLKVLTNAVSVHLLPKKVIKEVNLYLAKNERGDLFVTYFGTGSDSWLESALMVVEQAEQEWIAIEAAMQDGGYRTERAAGRFPTLAASDPNWEGLDEEPSAYFGQAIIQHTAKSDKDPVVAKMLEARR